MAEYITSRSNPLIGHIRKLSSSRAYRYETGEYLGDGVKLLAEAVRWGASLTAVVYADGISLPELPDDVRVVQVPADVMRSISPMESPQGVLFLAKIPSLTPPEALTNGRYLALEGVQDPGNIGTILRTADAFGASGLFLLPGCADLFNPKTVRSSMGALFRLPVWNCGLSQLQALSVQSKLPLFGTALRSDTIDIREADLRSSIILLGSEGRGLSAEALAVCSQTIKIPMEEKCESLNVAAAAALCGKATAHRRTRNKGKCFDTDSSARTEGHCPTTTGRAQTAEVSTAIGPRHWRQNNQSNRS